MLFVRTNFKGIDCLAHSSAKRFKTPSMGSASSSAIVTVAARAGAESAKTKARKDGSPRGLESGIWIIEYFINRGGKNLSPQ